MKLSQFLTLILLIVSSGVLFSQEKYVNALDKHLNLSENQVQEITELYIKYQLLVDEKKAANSVGKNFNKALKKLNNSYREELNNLFTADQKILLKNILSNQSINKKEAFVQTARLKADIFSTLAIQQRSFLNEHISKDDEMAITSLRPFFQEKFSDYKALKVKLSNKENYTREEVREILNSIKKVKNQINYSKQAEQLFLIADTYKMEIKTYYQPVAKGLYQAHIKSKKLNAIPRFLNKFSKQDVEQKKKLAKGKFLLIEPKAFQLEYVSVSELDAYPNPINEKFSVALDIKNRGRLLIKLYDLNGKLISVLEDLYVNQGSHTFEFNLVNLSAGNYILHVTTDQNQISEKLVKL